MSSKLQEDITEDDIQVGGTADVKWRKNGQSATYPAKLEKSRRTKAGVIEYKVHYKNWNKRYDEWVTLDRIMCVYDESGKVLKSRIDSSEEDENGDDDEVAEEPPKKKVNLRAKSKGEPKQEEPEEKPEGDKDESETEKDGSESDTVPVTTPKTSVIESGAGILDDLGNSDDEGSDENDETGSNQQSSKPVQCAAGCGKDAQVDSIYCSVECILKHAMKVPTERAKDGKPSPSTSGPSSLGTPRGEDIPALETAPPDEPPPEDDSRSDDEDFVPEDLEPKPKSKRDRKIKKESSKRSKSKSKENIKSPPPKSPKAHKKLTDKDIDDIMARVAGMKDEEPIMVMRYGALLTGVAAPRKNNLRKFLEENRVGAKVMLDDNTKSNVKQNPVRRRDDMIISNRNRLEKAKIQAERARPIQPVAPIIRETFKSDSGSKSTLNPYARKEETKKAIEKKDKPKKEIKKESRKDKNDEDEISGKDLMKLIRKAQKKEKNLEKQEKLAEKMDIALTPTREGKTIKRSGSIGENSTREIDGYLHPKKIRRSSDNNSTPNRPGSRTPEQADRTPEGQRHKARKMLRDILTQRSQNSDLKMDLQSITRLVSKIERSLCQKYQQPNKQYMAKFRQINFNLKDPQNDFFWRKVITGEIGSADLHAMSNMDMASKDLMESRKQQEKDHLDKIKRLEEERQKEALKPTAKITHKGEVEIENFEEPLEKTNDFGQVSDISLNVSISKEEKKDKKEKKKKDKKRRAEISKAEEDTINRMIAQKPKLNTPVEEPTANENDNAEVDDENQGLESPKTPDYYPDDNRDIPESPGTPDDPEVMASPQNMSPSQQTSDDNDDGKDDSSSISKVWSGKLSFPEASSFSANGYIISGTMDADQIKHSLTDRLNVVGRLDFSSAEKYINEVRQASDVNRISIMSLYGKSVNEQTGYSDSLFYLTSKNKVGVVNNFRIDGCLKDVYLVPLRENEKIPSFMEPFNGIGLSEQHPAILLALLVRKSDKKKTKPKPVVEKKEKKEELEYVSQEPPVKIQSISNELFNTIRESLNNPSLGLNPTPPIAMDPPPDPPSNSDFISTNIAPPAQEPYNEPYHDSYRPDRDFDRRSVGDNRDRDRRTFASRDYEPQRTSHWDNNRRDDYRRDDRQRKNDRGSSYRSNRRY